MKKIILVALVGLMLSCTNDSGSMELQSQEKLEQNNYEEFTLKAIYAGEKYIVPCLLDVKNDSIIYLDKAFSYLMNNILAENSRLVTRVHKDGYIEYVDFSQIADSSFACQSNDNNVITRGGAEPINITTYLHFWDDSNYKDRNYRIYLDPKGNRTWECPSLKDFHNFNDKISALKIVNNTFDGRSDVHFLGFQDNNYRGNVLEYVVGRPCLVSIPLVSESPLEIPKLKRIPMAGGKNWNDQISSIKFFY